MTNGRHLIALLVAVAVLTAACSVPTDESARVINPEDLPESLRTDVITSTTTTSIPPEVRTAQVTYYLLEPDNERVRAVVRDVVAPASMRQTLIGLFDDFRTQEEQDEGLRHALLEFELLSADRSDNLITIDITEVDPEGELAADAILNAVVQLVWTATEDDDIDVVRILIDSQPQILTTTRDEGDTEEGQPVDRSFFETFDPDFTQLTYFLLEPDDDRVRAVQVDAFASASVEETLAGLFDDFRTDAQREEGLRHALLRFRLLSANRVENVVTIDITRVDPESTLDADAIFDAVVQLVWTATADGDTGLVKILIDSQPQILRTTRPEGDTEEGESVDRSFFETFDPDFVPAAAGDEG